MCSCVGPTPSTQNDAASSRKPPLIALPAPNLQAESITASFLHIPCAGPGPTTSQEQSLVWSQSLDHTP